MTFNGLYSEIELRCTNDQGPTDQFLDRGPGQDQEKSKISDQLGLNSPRGLRVVGKGSWKDREVGKFLVGENFPT